LVGDLDGQCSESAPVAHKAGLVDAGVSLAVMDRTSSASASFLKGSLFPERPIHSREARRSGSLARSPEGETLVPSAAVGAADQVRPRPIASTALRREEGW
jgi:hypothetical protein